MNPFTLPGPEFLAFYFWFALGVIAVCWVRMRMGGGGRDASPDKLTQDPYRIAYLRGAKDEALRVATFNLVDRGILVYDDSKLRVARPEAKDFLRRKLDRALLEHCEKGATVDSVRAAPRLAAACDEYDRELREAGLLLDRKEELARSHFVGWAMLLLLGVAGIKVAYALFQGRGNVFFLVVMTIVAAVILLVVYSHRLTRAGQRALKNLETLTKRLKGNTSRVKPGGASNEALLLAAVFGLHALPAEAFPFVEAIQPRPKSSDSSGGSDGGGGSCGGGCGGGCGGCGGD